jgi:hypothetical protein
MRLYRAALQERGTRSKDLSRHNSWFSQTTVIDQSKNDRSGRLPAHADGLPLNDTVIWAGYLKQVR